MRSALPESLCLCLLLAGAADSAPPRKPVIADFDAELRREDGHIDTPAMIRALKDLGVNTYFYLIWHSRHDWTDLPEFARAAAKEGIDVWVYLIPWSETPLVKRSWGFSEPFRTDYVRWAEEIARLSLEQRNIVGYVIDDFYTNTQNDRFSIPYVRRMVQAARDINPKIRFYPLVYFQQPWKDFVDRFGSLVDGVVAAYPKSRLQIGNALAYLNDDAHGASAVIDLPRQPTRTGDMGSIWADVRVRDAAEATLSFYWDDDDHTTQHGYHTAFVKVDGRTVFEADTAGQTEDNVVEIPLARLARGRDRLRIEMGVIESRGVSKYPVRVKLDDIRLTGFDTPSEMASEKLWSRKVTGPFEVNLQPSNHETGRFSIPMIIMPAGEGPQHEKRYRERGSARNIAAKVRLSLDMMRRRQAEGVVTYCLPKDPGDSIYQAVRDEFLRARRDLAAEAAEKEPR